jgi:DNA ligase-1
LGVDVKTINKIFPNLIPTFDVGLCDVFDGKELPKGNWAIEAKLDGLRCLVFIDTQGVVSFKSRTGKDLYNLEHIEKEIQTLHLKNIVLDGEIYTGKWETSVSIAQSEKNSGGKNKESAKYYVFDILDLENEWKKQKSLLSYKQRKARLKEIFFNCKTIIYVAGSEVYNMTEAKLRYNKLLDEGFEGAVLKNINAVYPFDRSKDWIKWKTMISEDLEIIGYEPGDGRNKDRLGAFICDFKGKKVKVGGGYSDELRVKFWKEKDNMIGKIIETQCQGITPDGSLRFPVFTRLRIDK